MTKEDTCRNGDKLDHLNQRKQELDARVMKYERELREAEAKLDPLRELLVTAVAESMNVSCRLNIWWNEYRTANQPKRHPFERY